MTVVTTVVFSATLTLADGTAPSLVIVGGELGDVTELHVVKLTLLRSAGRCNQDSDSRVGRSV